MLRKLLFEMLSLDVLDSQALIISTFVASKTKRVRTVRALFLSVASIPLHRVG